MSELVQAARRELVAGQPDELVLAREVAVDGPDRQTALADDVRDGRAVVALLAEDAGRGGQDPVPDLLLVGGTDTGHDRLPKRMDVHRNLAHGRAERNHPVLTKRMVILYLPRVRPCPERNSDVQPLGSVRLPLPSSRRPPRRHHRDRQLRARDADLIGPVGRRLARRRIPNRRPSRPASTPSSAPARARSSRSSGPRRPAPTRRPTSSRARSRRRPPGCRPCPRSPASSATPRPATRASSARPGTPRTSSSS